MSVANEVQTGAVADGYATGRSRGQGRRGGSGRRFSATASSR